MKSTQHAKKQPPTGYSILSLSTPIKSQWDRLEQSPLYIHNYSGIVTTDPARLNAWFDDLFKQLINIHESKIQDACITRIKTALAPGQYDEYDGGSVADTILGILREGDS